MELKSYKHRRAYLLITNDVLRQLDYNVGMSAQHIKPVKMYAELERKVCSKCRLAKELNCFNNETSGVNGKYSYCKECKKEYRRAHAKLNRHKLRAYERKRQLRRFYKITVEQYDLMFEKQDGKCGICAKHQKDCKRRLAVDHCKVTGQIRMLLCDNCNPGIGYFKHSVEYMKLAIAYLEKFKN